MTKTLNSISRDAPANPVTAAINDTFAFSGTPGFTGTGGVNRYDFKWEVNPGSGYVTIDNSTTGLRTAATNPVTNTNQATQFSATITCTAAGSYTIRMSGAPTTGGSYTVFSATQTVTVTQPIVVSPGAASLALTGSAPAVATPIVVSPSAPSLSLTGSAPVVSIGTSLSPGIASLSLTGSAPTVATTDNVALAPSAASLSITGNAPAVALPIAASPAGASLSLAGSTPTVNVSAGSSISALPSAFALTLTAATPSVAITDNIVLLPTPAALMFQGSSPYVGWPEPPVVGPFITGVNRRLLAEMLADEDHATALLVDWL